MYRCSDNFSVFSLKLHEFVRLCRLPVHFKFTVEVQTQGTLASENISG
jgi:hypothetical protein